MRSTPKNLVIVCPRTEGHRLSYVRLLIEQGNRDSVVPTVLLPTGASEHEDYKVHIADRGLSYVLDESSSPYLRARQLLRLSDGSVFIFPDGDDIVRDIALRRLRPLGNRIVVLVMRPHGQAASVIARLVGSAAKSSLRTLARTQSQVAVLTLCSAIKLNARRNEVRDPIDFNPDVADVQALKSEWSDFAGGSTSWFGIVGAVSSRKNVALVAEALARVHGDVGLVVAGRVHEGEARLVEWVHPFVEAGGPFVRIPGPLDDSELDSILASLDVAVIAHSNDGPSGILGKASAAGIRVLAAGAPTLRRDLKTNPTLGLWVKLEPPAVALAAQQLCSRNDDGLKHTVVNTPVPFAKRLISGRRSWSA